MSEQATSQEIFSSTGQLGTSVRQDGRLYHNATMFYDDPTKVEDTFLGLVQEATGINENVSVDQRISRVMFRGIVSDQSLRAIASSGLGECLEVAMPVSEERDAGWLIYLAENHSDRHALHPVEAMVEETAEYTSRLHRPVASRHPLDWVLRTAVEDGDHASLRDLWGPTFGWNSEEISHLAEKLQAEKDTPQQERSVWFSAIAAGKTLVSAAMAERLTLPGRNRDVELVESTEWRTHDDYADLGLMTRNLRALNSQIFDSFKDSPAGPPIVYAECSFTSRAYRPGYGGGFHIPERRYAAQIAIQNVTVDDGIARRGLRDFIVMRAQPPAPTENM